MKPFSFMLKVAIVFIIALVGGFLFFNSPYRLSVLDDARQKRALQSRADYSQIANACVSLAHAVTNQTTFIQPANPIVPPLLRSLSPHYLTADTNFVAIEFHGGLDHYGYIVRQSDTNASHWTISWYTESGERHLGTVLRD